MIFDISLRLSVGIANNSGKFNLSSNKSKLQVRLLLNVLTNEKELLCLGDETHSCPSLTSIARRHIHAMFVIHVQSPFGCVVNKELFGGHVPVDLCTARLHVLIPPATRISVYQCGGMSVVTNFLVIISVSSYED